jgi:hypothetical protein
LIGDSSFPPPPPLALTKFPSFSLHLRLLLARKTQTQTAPIPNPCYPFGPCSSVALRTIQGHPFAIDHRTPRLDFLKRSPSSRVALPCLFVSSSTIREAAHQRKITATTTTTTTTTTTPVCKAPARRNHIPATTTSIDKFAPRTGFPLPKFRRNKLGRFFSRSRTVVAHYVFSQVKA